MIFCGPHAWLLALPNFVTANLNSSLQNLPMRSDNESVNKRSSGWSLDGGLLTSGNPSALIPLIHPASSQCKRTRIQDGFLCASCREISKQQISIFDVDHRNLCAHVAIYLKLNLKVFSRNSDDLGPSGFQPKDPHTRKNFALFKSRSHCLKPFTGKAYSHVTLYFLKTVPNCLALCQWITELVCHPFCPLVSLSPLTQC